MSGTRTAPNPRAPSTFGRMAVNPGYAGTRITAEEHDPTCPDCRGKRIDKHGFDCSRCFGEGVIDE